MATVNKTILLDQLGRVPGTDSNGKTKALEVNTQLLDTVMCSTYSNVVNTVSGSGVVNIPLTQPANTVLEDIIPICTAATSHDNGVIGFKVGNAAFGGAQIVAAVNNAIAGAGTSTAVGQGASIHQKIRTSLQGGADLVIAAGAGYTATERTIYCQVSASAGPSYFKDNNGAFKVIAKYYNL